MNKIFKGNIRRFKTFLLFSFLLFLFPCYIFSQNTTVVQGVVRDSLTREVISYATIRFEDSTVGDLSDDSGKFRLRNRQNKNVLVVSLMGYHTKKTTVPIGKTTTLEVLLSPEGVNLSEIVIRPQKEKYSKKNNPAVELIKKVIANKDKYIITNQNYYKCDEYDRIFFAFNEFDPTDPLFKKFKFLPKYERKSRIDEKTILPFSVRETLSESYYRKNPKARKRIITAYQNEGLDQQIDTEVLNTVVTETFKEINITDNNINLFFRDFVGPLNSNNAVDFYKWYIIDTVNIEDKRYINLGFVPFNPRDVGFSGNLYITTDSTYAIKRVSMRVPTKINVNFIESMLVEQEFEELSPNLWIPTEFTTSMEFSLYDVFKFYVEKVKTYNNFEFNQPLDVVFLNPAPEIYLSDYDKHDAKFWKENRPSIFNEDYNMDSMMEELLSNKFINITVKLADIISSGYIATSKDPEKNKVDIGTTETFYSFNRLEGNRLRLTAATTKNFHEHFFLYGYAAYGFKDQKIKYMGEATWAFNKKEYHKDEFPRNNLSISYKYDVTALGQQFLQAERDNIVLSLGGGSKDAKLMYDRASQISYMREYYNGLSVNMYGITHDQKPAMNITFEKFNEINNKLDTLSDFRTSELGLVLRYAPDEKFYQKRRRRRNLPAKGFIYNLTFVKGMKDVLRGQYDYTKLSASVNSEIWIAPYGKIRASVQGDKIWGEVPYPLLLSANANNSVTIQKGSFYLLKPLEFVNDIQASWDVSYRMGGWFLNRVPVIKTFKWREVFEFRGFIGSLSKKNNPLHNKNLMLFPEDAYSMTNTPYMEFNVGIENIFKFFRIDYVRRLNYLDHPGIDKDGFRINFEFSF